MVTVDIGEKALAICETHFDPSRNGCAKCPVCNECLTNRPVRSMVEMEVWRNRLNEAAEKVA